MLSLSAQLPPAIAGWIAATFGVEGEHIRGTSLAQMDDEAVFAALRKGGRVMATEDEDFADLVTRLDPSAPLGTLE